MRIFEPTAILTPNIWGYLWSKLAYGALLFATALTNESIADCLAEPKFRPVFIAPGARGRRDRGGGEDQAGAVRRLRPARLPARRRSRGSEPRSTRMVVHNRKSAKTP